MFCQRNSGWVSVTAQPLELNCESALKVLFSASFQFVLAVPLITGSSSARPCGSFSMPASSCARDAANTASFCFASR